MRKAIAITITIAAVCILFPTAVSAETKTECSSEEQVLLRLLYDPAYDAIEEYYGEPRQYWQDRILRVRKVPDTPYYEVVMQAETFDGLHNPPYGMETMTFYVSYGDVILKSYEHREEPD
ncbi:MAG: DUF3888 domain-containing protein [Oscillospiraceae bacterium]|nr:DUF3888 domain-containing protein [Oscillospiraceae bacterium]